MKLTKKQLLGVNITVSSKEDVLSLIAEYVHEGSEAIKKTPCIVFTPNSEQLVAASKDKQFQLLLNRADIALPDGIGVVLGLSILRGITIQRISGIDFLSDLIRLATKEHRTIGFIGGRNDMAHKALTALQSSYVELHGWSEQPKDFEDTTSIATYSMDKIVRRIIDSQTRFVFVGLGAPKQEVFIDALKKQVTKKHAGPVVIMAVGGSFDMIAGAIPRAPSWMQTFGLEWVYRLAKEPWRWKRQCSLFSFGILVFKEKFFHTNK